MHSDSFSVGTPSVLAEVLRGSRLQLQGNDGTVTRFGHGRFHSHRGHCEVCTPTRPSLPDKESFSQHTDPEVPGSIPGASRFSEKQQGLERGLLSLVRTTEELLERKSSGSGLENRD
jgi:hypothetical protein